MHPSRSWNNSGDYPYQNGTSSLRNLHLPNASNYSHNSNDNNWDDDPDFERQINEVLKDIGDDLKSGKLDCYFDINDKEKDAEKDKELNFQKTRLTGQEALSDEDDYDSDAFENSDVPDWYHQKLQQKKKEMEYRLQYLGNAAQCEGLREHVQRQVEDHGTVYCKYDTPKYPSFKKAWTNIWKFSCIVKCRFEGTVYKDHEHSQKCQQYLLQDKNGVSCNSDNLLEIEYPKFIMSIVQDFQDFINGNCQEPSCCYNKSLKKNKNEILYTDLLIKTNHKKEVLLTVEGSGIEGYEEGKLNTHLSVVRKMFNIVLVYKVRRRNKNSAPILVSGSTTIQHKINSNIALPFVHKPLLFVNIVEIDLLKKTLIQVLQLSRQTTLVDIGCGIGLISNLLAPKCDKVIGLDTGSGHIKQAEDISNDNKIYNADFRESKPTDLFQKLSAFCKQCKTVVILKQDSVYGKNKTSIRCLKQLPSVCQIVMWGPFEVSKDIVPTVCLLTQKEDDGAIPFYPKSACLLDKSPKNKDNFDIVLVFERESIVIDSKPSELDIILKKDEKVKIKPSIKIRSDLVSNDIVFDRTVVYNDHPFKFHEPDIKEESEPTLPEVHGHLTEQNLLPIPEHIQQEYEEFEQKYITGTSIDHKPNREILEDKKPWKTFPSLASNFDISGLETPVVNPKFCPGPSTSQIQSHAGFSLDTSKSFIPSVEPIDSESSESDWEEKPKIKVEKIKVEKTIKKEEEEDDDDLISQRDSLRKQLEKMERRKKRIKKRDRHEKQNSRDRDRRREKESSYERKDRDRYYDRDRYNRPLNTDRRYRSRSRSPSRYSSRPSYARRSRSRERDVRRSSNDYKRSVRRLGSRESS